MSDRSPNAFATPPVRWAEFLALPDDDRRELIDGLLVEVEVPRAIHEAVVSGVIIELGLWARQHGGLVVGSGYKVRVSETRGVMPDVQFYRKGRGRLPDLGLEAGSPDLAVEVVSPSSVRYERVRKLNWYRDIGTPEYWIIDPETGSVEQFVLDGAGYRLVQACELGDQFAPATFPGMVIDVSALLDPPNA